MKRVFDFLNDKENKNLKVECIDGRYVIYKNNFYVIGRSMEEVMENYLRHVDGATDQNEDH